MKKGHSNYEIEIITLIERPVVHDYGHNFEMATAVVFGF